MIYEVKAILRPEMLDHVLASLGAIPEMPGVAVTQIRALGRRVMNSTRRDETAEIMMARIEVVVPDLLLEQTTSAIAAAARTGRHGDGKIFVTAIHEVIRIRTGERGRDAI